MLRGSFLGIPRLPSPWVQADQCGFHQVMLLDAGARSLPGYKAGSKESSKM